LGTTRKLLRSDRSFPMVRRVIMITKSRTIPALGPPNHQSNPGANKYRRKFPNVSAWPNPQGWLERSPQGPRARAGPLGFRIFVYKALIT
jgi:hypothetical protein